MSVMKEVAEELDAYPPSKLSIRTSNHIKELYLRFRLMEMNLKQVQREVIDANDAFPVNSAQSYLNSALIGNLRFFEWAENSVAIDYCPVTLNETFTVINSLTILMRDIKMVGETYAAFPADNRLKVYHAKLVAESITKTMKNANLAQEVLSEIYKDIEKAAMKK